MGEFHRSADEKEGWTSTCFFGKACSRPLGALPTLGKVLGNQVSDLATECTAAFTLNATNGPSGITIYIPTAFTAFLVLCLSLDAR